MTISLMYQLWILLTFSSAVGAGLLGVIILQQKFRDSDNVAKFKKAVAFAFLSVTAEALSRFLSLIFNTAPIPASELIICSVGRFVELIGLWGLLFYIMNIWPFAHKLDAPTQ